MAHLKAALDGERKKEVTDAMQLGSALHVACLTPEEMPNHVVLWSGGTRRGGSWDEFCEEHEGKIILTPVMHEKLVGMTRALRRHKVMREWMGRIEGTEVAVVGDVHGVTMKARADAMTPDPLIDLKSTRSCDLRTITNTVMTFGYDIQGEIYRHLYNRERFILLFVEDAPPHDVVAVELSPSFLRRGRREAVSLIQRYQYCQKTGVWPGREPDNVVMLEVPEWAMSNDEADAITIDGEAAF